MRLSEIRRQRGKIQPLSKRKKGCPEVSAASGGYSEPEGLGSSEEPHEHAPHATEATAATGDASKGTQKNSLSKRKKEQPWKK